MERVHSQQAERTRGMPQAYDRSEPALSQFSDRTTDSPAGLL